jgi:hypothetical protein
MNNQLLMLNVDDFDESTMPSKVEEVRMSPASGVNGASEMDGQKSPRDSTPKNSIMKE